jgi:hypothetical protein
MQVTWEKGVKEKKLEFYYRYIYMFNLVYKYIVVFQYK